MPSTAEKWKWGEDGGTKMKSSFGRYETEIVWPNQSRIGFSAAVRELIAEH